MINGKEAKDPVLQNSKKDALIDNENNQVFLEEFSIVARKLKALYTSVRFMEHDKFQCFKLWYTRASSL